MNRLELEKKIIEEGKRRGIKIEEVMILADQGPLRIFVYLNNDRASKWVSKYQVQELVKDLSPIEREIEKIEVDLRRSSRIFKIGSSVEVDNIWIRLDAGEPDPKEMKMSAGCGQYRQGWFKGEVFETPEQNDRALGVKFKRDIYLAGKDEWYGDVAGLERAISEGRLKKVEAGQPVWMGHCTWTVRVAS